MKAAIVYDSRTHTTEKAAGFIAEGLNSVADIEVKCFNIDIESGVAGIYKIFKSGSTFAGPCIHPMPKL